MATVRQDTKPSRFMDVGEVADTLGVHRATVLAWIKAGDLPAVNVTVGDNAKKNHFRIKRIEFEAFVAKRSTVAADPQLV